MTTTSQKPSYENQALPRTRQTDALTPANNAALIHNMISQRAYALWQLRGCPIGTPLQDWSQAEADVKQSIQRTRKSRV